MSNKIKQTKGITLIALVVTIIVLLILVGISISMLTGQNGILNRATEAKEVTGKTQTIEQLNIATAGAIARSLGTINYADLKAELDAGFGTGTYTITPQSDATTWKITISGNEYKIKNTGAVAKVIQNTNGTAPYLPSESFSVVEGTSLESGLVIKDIAGNEYVWIEVPNDGTGPTYTSVTSDTDYTNIASALQAYAENYRNGAAWQSCDWTDEWYASDGSINISASTENLTEEQKMLKNGCGLTYYEYEELYQEMLSSVYTNGGFWIGRYEMGAKEATESNTTILSSSTNYTPVSQANQIPYTYITCSQAQELASKMNSGNYTSSLMFGIQWDLVMKYLEKKGTSYEDLAGSNSVTSEEGSSNWGNYYDTPEIKIINEDAKYNIDPWNRDSWNSIGTSYTKSGGVLLTTGASDTFSKQNIFDLAGNVDEWTLEHATSIASSPGSGRGGQAAAGGFLFPASSRLDYCASLTTAKGRAVSSPIGCHACLGSRVALY